jgi:integrase
MLGLRIRGTQWRQKLSDVSHAEAVRILKDKQADAAAGRTPSARSTTVGELVQMYLDVSRLENHRGTYESYEGLNRLHIAPSELAGIKLTRLTSTDAQRFVTERSRTGQQSGKWGPRRVELMCALLRSSFNLGMHQKPQLISWNPFAGGKRKPVRLPRVSRPKIKGLSHAEAMALLQVIEGHEHEHLYWLLFTTGLRIGEALGLQWSDVDFGRYRLRVEHNLDPLKGREWSLDETKTEAGVRVIPLIADAVEHLQAQLARKIRRLSPDFVFVDALGEPYTQDSVRSHMLHLAVKAGVRRNGPKTTVSPHDLRRSAATFLHGQGVPLGAVQTILGHTSIETTLRYIDGASDEMLDQAQAAMEQAMLKVKATRSN